MNITITNRTQIVNADTTRVHQNLATDFSELACGHIENTQGFVDTLTMLELTANSTNKIQLSKGHAFVRYLKDGRVGFARCEIVNAIDETITDSDGDYYLSIKLNTVILNNGSATVDGTDVFTLDLESTAPTGYDYTIYKINKSGNDITILEDYRKKRDLGVDFSEIAGNIDLSELNSKELKDLDDVDSALSPSADEILAYNGSTNKFETKGLSDVANIKKMVREATLGEPVTAGDGKGAVFYGNGLVDTKEINQTTGGSDIIIGNGTSQKARALLPVPNASDFANILREAVLSIKKASSPTDNLTFSLYEDDGTTKIIDLLEQPGSGLTTSFDDINLFSHAVSGQITDSFGPASGNSNSSIYGDCGIRITATNDCVLKGFNAYSVLANNHTVTIENETDSVTTTIASQGNANNQYIDTNNFLMESGKTYRISIHYNSGTKPKYVDKTFPLSYGNFDIISGYHNGVDSNRIYVIDNFITQEITGPTPIQANLSGYEGQNIYLQIERDSAQDAVNYYVIEGATGGDTIDTRDGVDWNAQSKNLVINMQRGYNFEEDKVRLSDSRYTTTHRCDGIMIESGVSDDVKKMIFAGKLAQTSVDIGDNYWLNNADGTTRGEFTTTKPATTPFLIGKGDTTTEIGLMINEQNFPEKTIKIQSGINMSDNTVYQADTDGFVICSASDSNDDCRLSGYVDDVDGTTEIIKQGGINSGYDTAITFVVKKGQYYKIKAITSSTLTLRTAKFYPLSA